MSCSRPCGATACSKPTSVSWQPGWCGRSGHPAEIGEALQVDDLMPVLGRVLRQPPRWPMPYSTGSGQRFPDRLEPLAAAGRLGPRLPVARALVWSSRLRRRGLAGACPLVAMATDATLDPRVRILAGAAAFGTFGERAVVNAVHDARGLLDPSALEESTGEIARIAPGLLEAGHVDVVPMSPAITIVSGTAERGRPARLSHDVAGGGPGGPPGRDQHRGSVRGHLRRGCRGADGGHGVAQPRDIRLHHVLPCGRPTGTSGVGAWRPGGPSLRHDPVGAHLWRLGQLRDRPRCGVVRGSLHDRHVALGSRAALRGHGHRGPHGPRDLGSLLVHRRRRGPIDRPPHSPHAPSGEGEVGRRPRAAGTAPSPSWRGSTTRPGSSARIRSGRWRPSAPRSTPEPDRGS